VTCLDLDSLQWFFIVSYLGYEVTGEYRSCLSVGKSQGMLAVSVQGQFKEHEKKKSRLRQLMALRLDLLAAKFFKSLWVCSSLFAAIKEHYDEILDYVHYLIWTKIPWLQVRYLDR